MHKLRFHWMLRELFGVVTDLVPSGLVDHKLMKTITNDGIIIQAVSRNGKGVLLRLDLTQRRATLLAEASYVFEGWLWFVTCDELLPLSPTKRILRNKNEGARSYFPAPRAMTRPHHAWRR
jgi:hypothetical protein